MAWFEVIEHKKNAFRVYSVECVSKIYFDSPNYRYAIYEAVRLISHIFWWWLWKYVYFILVSQSNPKYEPLTIV